MAKSIEPDWPSRCDSIRGFHLFWAAALRGNSDDHSGIVWESGLALGDARDCWDAPRTISRAIKHSATDSGPRDLDRHWFRRLAMGNGRRIRKEWGASRLAVLCCGRGKPDSACRIQVFSGDLAQKRVWFSRNFLHHISSIGCGNLPARQSHRPSWDARFLDVPFFLPNYFIRANRPLPTLCRRVEEEANVH